MKTFVLYEKDIYHGNLVLINKNYLLKISEEPWHFRYVGFPHSVIVEGNNFDGFIVTVWKAIA